MSTSDNVPHQVPQDEPHPFPPEKPSRARATPPAGQKPLIAPDLRDDAIAALREGLKATRRFWDKASGMFQEEPDYAARTRAAELVLAYAEGRPIERQVKLSGDFSSYSDKLAKLVATPSGLKQAIALGLVEKPQKDASTVEIAGNSPAVATEDEISRKANAAQRTHNQVIDLE